MLSPPEPMKGNFNADKIIKPIWQISLECLSMPNRNNGNQNNIDNDALEAFIRMRRFATTLFFIMVALYIITKIFEQKFHFLSYFRAFGEAAMVGALADWFAVTALFRRPMGLPIPHTAIIPRSKDRIGIGLGRFISRNFLQPQQVEQRLENVDLAGGFANWLNKDERAHKLASGLAAALPRLTGLLKDGPIANWLKETIINRLQQTDIATLFADGLALLTREKRHKPIVDLIIFHADLYLNSQESEFRKKVTSNTEWLPKLLSIDAKAADALLNSMHQTLSEASKDPNHSIRAKIDDALQHLEHNLRFDPELRSELSAWIIDLSRHKVISDYIGKIWEDIKQSFSAPSPDGNEKLINAISGFLEEIASAIIRNDELRESLNTKLKQWAIELSANQGEAVGDMVADTIKGWDASTVVSQIENAVGRDLQYIRINGTLIGGLVGLFIHTLSQILLP